jgi:four helix bundle protein
MHAPPGVGVRRFEDLIAWQLADELHRQVLEFTDTFPVRSDRNFCNQIRTASRSAKTNTSEGFGRYYRREFIRFLRIAAASLQEAKDHLHEAKQRKFIDEDKYTGMVRLTLRALKANIRLQHSLRRNGRDRGDDE